MGRKREMKLVEDMTARKVTFSKRKRGLFKKANELVTLSGSEIAIVLFSPAGKPFSFASPNVKLLTEWFLNDEEPNSKVENGELENLNQQLIHLEDQVKIEVEKGRDLEKAKNENIVLNIRSNFDDLKLHLSEVEASAALLLLAEAPLVN